MTIFFAWTPPPSLSSISKYNPTYLVTGPLSSIVILDRVPKVLNTPMLDKVDARIRHVLRQTHERRQFHHDCVRHCHVHRRQACTRPCLLSGVKRSAVESTHLLAHYLVLLFGCFSLSRSSATRPSRYLDQPHHQSDFCSKLCKEIKAGMIEKTFHTQAGLYTADF